MNIWTTNTLSLLLAGLIVIVAATIISFSRRYMDGDKNYGGFFKTLLLLTAAALTMVFANHVAIFAAAWFIMGMLLAKLIGHVKGRAQAQASAKIARNQFMIGSISLVAALAILVIQTKSWFITDITAQINTVDTFYLWVSGGLIALAAMMQSALFPFHKWLLASMTAPTPVSAFMHAGLVNAGGFLIVRFAPLYTAMPDMLLILFALGALTAFLASFWMLSQSDIKRGLGCSTVAQMGFMVMQCGLGLYTAAITHLILHGFYKAYHFLAAGSAIEHPKRPQDQQNNNIFVTLILMLGGGIIAALVFASLSGKSFTSLDSNLILIAFAALAGMQAAQGIAQLAHIHIIPRAALMIFIIALAAALYAVTFASVNAMLPINAPQALSWVHVAALVIFTASWLLMTLGLHKKSPKAYMASLNAAQPPLNTVLNHRSSYNA